MQGHDMRVMLWRRSTAPWHGVWPFSDGRHFVLDFSPFLPD